MRKVLSFAVVSCLSVFLAEQPSADVEWGSPGGNGVTVTGTTPPAASAGESHAPSPAAIVTNPSLQRVSRLLGKEVVNANGENLGSVYDVVIDSQTGRIAYMVLSFGGFMGIGEKLFAVPAKALQPQPGGDKMVLNVEKDRLKDAPGFDRDNWPNLANREWGTQVHEYYGVTPYWQESEPEPTTETIEGHSPPLPGEGASQRSGIQGER
jgi:sporulation protein YlmC with PRC-barrel domain